MFYFAFIGAYHCLANDQVTLAVITFSIFYFLGRQSINIDIKESV